MDQLTSTQVKHVMRNPKEMEALFRQYCVDNGLQISQEKTFASMELYHEKALTIGATTEFFTGDYDSSRTNVPNSFSRQESEHMLILGMRVLNDQNPDITLADWTAPSIAVVKGSTLTANVNSVDQLKEFPISAMFSTAEASAEYGTTLLRVPFMWPGQTSLKLTLNPKDGTVAPGDNVRVSLFGVGLI